MVLTLGLGPRFFALNFRVTLCETSKVILSGSQKGVAALTHLSIVK